MELDLPRASITLPSGARLLHIDTKSLPGNICHVQVDIAAGDDYEEKSTEREAAHYIEHLIASLLRSDATTSIVDVKTHVEQMGIASNASTSAVRTSYFMNGLEQHLETMIQIQVGSVAQFLKYYNNPPRTPASDIERYPKEAAAVKRELEARFSNPSFMLYEALQAVLYPNHPRSISSAVDAKNVVTMTPDTVRDFFQRMYVASNMLIVVATRRPLDEVAGLLKKYTFSPAPRPRRPVFTGSFPTNTMIFVPTPAIASNIILVWPVEYTRFESRAEHAFTALSSILAGGFSSRLLDELRVEEGLVYSISADAQLDEEQQRMSTYVIETSVATENTVQVVNVILEIVGQLAKSGPTDTEMETFRQRVTASRERKKLVLLPSTYVNAYAEQDLFTKNIETIEESFDIALNLTREDVQEIARNVFAPPRRPPLVVYTGSATVARQLGMLVASSTALSSLPPARAPLRATLETILARTRAPVSSGTRTTYAGFSPQRGADTRTDQAAAP